MKEIMMPVLVIDDDCRMCEDLEIISEATSRIYANDECIDQSIRVRCSNVYKCQRLKKRFES